MLPSARCSTATELQTGQFDKKLVPETGLDSNHKLASGEMRALSEPARVAVERQQRIRFFEEKLVPLIGFEPTTPSLRMMCSTD